MPRLELATPCGESGTTPSVYCVVPARSRGYACWERCAPSPLPTRPQAQGRSCDPSRAPKPGTFDNSKVVASLIGKDATTLSASLFQLLHLASLTELGLKELKTATVTR